MKKWYWFVGAMGFWLIIMSLGSAMVTATGAFGADISKRVNRVDFVWAAVGLAALIFSIWKTKAEPNQK